MTKESKTTTTIRRRKGKQVAMALQKIREDNPKPVAAIATEEELKAAEIEDKCYLFDDRVLGPIVLRRLMSNEHSLFLALLAIRFVNALLIQTYFVPDEYWQSLEVAHNMVFGYGYLTWEWKEGLRGYSYPLLFAVLYKMFYIFGLDSRIILIKGPRIVQGVIAAWGDFHLYKLSSRISGRTTAQWTLLCQLMSWFTIYCCTRTLTNSTETSLMIVALSYFPWPDSKSNRNDVYKFLALAALSVIVRPTSALVWILLCTWHLQRIKDSPAFSSVVSAYILVGGSTFLGSLVVDRIWYGYWTIVQFNFLWFNVVQGGASIYGVHPWHWYFLQGVPVVIGSLLLPFVVGAWKAKNKTLLWIILWILATHSFQAHKEFRFILPIVPLAMHFCGVFFQQLCVKPPLKKFYPPKLAKEMEARTQKEPVTSESEDKLSDAEAVDSDISSKSESATKSADEKKIDEDFKNKQSTTSEGLGDSTEIIDGEKQDEDDKNKDSDKEEKTQSKEESKDGKARNEKDSTTKVKAEKESEEVTNNDQDQDSKEPKSGSGDVSESASSKSVAEIETSEKDQSSVVDSDKDKEQTVEEIKALRDRVHQRNLFLAKIMVIFIAVTNVLPAMYFSLIHKRGTVLVPTYLHQASVNNPAMNVMFLMPCHSTPYYSHLHQNISMRFLTCEPNLKGVKKYREEQDLFYENPQQWLREEFEKTGQHWPSHLVYFNTLHRDISNLLTQKGYKICETFFHTQIPEGREGNQIYISCRWSVMSM